MILACAAIVTFSVPIWVHAVGLMTPFGGRIIFSMPCTCGYGTLVVLGPPRGGMYIYYPGSSTLYRNYNIFHSGPAGLGMANPTTGTCLIYAGTTCFTINAPVMWGIGSSAI